MIKALLLWDKWMELQLMCSRYRGSSNHIVWLYWNCLNSIECKLSEGRTQIWPNSVHPRVHKALPIVSCDQHTTYFSSEWMRWSSNGSNCLTLHQGDFYFSTSFLPNSHYCLFNTCLVTLLYGCMILLLTNSLCTPLWTYANISKEQIPRRARTKGIRV